MATKETAIIEATVYWPNLSRPNDMSGKYQVDLGNLKPKAIKTLKGLGINVKTDKPKDEDKPDRGKFVTAKSNYPISVVFKDDVEEVDPSQIGNGSKVRAKVNPYTWTFKKDSGVSLGVQKVQVVELEKYEVDDDFDDFDDDEDDFDDELNDDFED